MGGRTSSRDTTNRGRRKFLINSSAIALSASFPQLIQAATTINQEKSLAFLNLHTNETLQCSYWENGDYDLKALAEINYILRDHRTNEVTEIDRQLLNTLHTLHQLTESNSPFQIISGYRSAKTNNTLRNTTSGVAKRSLHMQGKAIDVQLPDIQLATLRDTAISLQAGGVGYYPKTSFLHLDTANPRNW